MHLNRNDIQKLADFYWFCESIDDDDFAGMFELVADIFDAERDRLKEEEPYAINTIERYRQTAYELRCLGAEVDEVMTEVDDED